MILRQFTRRHFLGTAAALAVPTVVPGSLFAMDKAGDLRPTAASLRQINACLAASFGCSVNAFSQAKTTVVSHHVPAYYRGALVFRHAESCIVSVPDSVSDVERSRLSAASPDEVLDPRLLVDIFPTDPGKISGPAWIGIADRVSFRPVKTVARILDNGDEPALWKLAEGCGQLDWSRARLCGLPKPIFGLFQGTDLVAASGYVVSRGLLACIGVLVHPAFRGKGYARAAVSASAADALSNGHIALWRSLESNKGAVAFGRSMGFHPYASTLDVDFGEYAF